MRLWWFSKHKMGSSTSFYPRRSAWPKLMAKWRQLKRRQWVSEVTYVEKKWLTFTHNTLLPSLCRRECWLPPLSGVFSQPSVHVGSARDRCRAVPGTSTCSATSRSHPDKLLVPGHPQDAPRRLSLFLRNICLERREFPPKLMFYFPIFLLDLNLVYLLTQTYSDILCVNFCFEPDTPNLT